MNPIVSSFHSSLPCALCPSLEVFLLYVCMYVAVLCLCLCLRQLFCPVYVWSLFRFVIVSCEVRWLAPVCSCTSSLPANRQTCGHLFAVLTLRCQQLKKLQETFHALFPHQQLCVAIFECTYVGPVWQSIAQRCVSSRSLDNGRRVRLFAISPGFYFALPLCFLLRFAFLICRGLVKCFKRSP